MIAVAHVLRDPLTFMGIVFYLIESYLTSPTCGLFTCRPLP